MKTSQLKLAVIGRPNVGKSTLFNRLFGQKRALVHDEPGVTRDRLEAETHWWVRARKVRVTLVDTGGMGGERFSEEIDQQVARALEQVDVALFVFDGQVGLSAEDQSLLRKLLKSGFKNRAKIIGVVNKIDHEKHEALLHDFYTSGLEHLVTISAEHGRGIEDLKELIVAEAGIEGVEYKDDSEDLEEKANALAEYSEDSKGDSPRDLIEARGLTKLAIVGRPNVGKSTLVNALLGEQRVITSPIAGTTVDSIDLIADIAGRKMQIIDTAGIRRKSKTERGIEVLSVVQTKKALERADVALLLLDGETGVTDQDEKIAGMIEEIGCSVILVVNKWDTQKNNPKFTKEEAAERIRGKMAFIRYAPILFISAIKGQGIEPLADLVEEILNQRQLKVATHEFTEWIRKESTVHNPGNVKFFLCHQSGRHPPTFVCHVNHPDKIHFSLKRYLMNTLREKWGYMGTPVRLLFIEDPTRRTAPPKRSSESPRHSAPGRGLSKKQMGIKDRVEKRANRR